MGLNHVQYQTYRKNLQVVTILSHSIRYFFFYRMTCITNFIYLLNCYRSTLTVELKWYYMYIYQSLTIARKVDTNSMKNYPIHTATSKREYMMSHAARLQHRYVTCGTTTRRHMQHDYITSHVARLQIHVHDDDTRHGYMMSYVTRLHDVTCNIYKQCVSIMFSIKRKEKIYRS